ncbi:MAG: galactokinase, partial [Lachnospiraceae bacterium]|nr:galactokinase [Lachnospiraceae bacterium]
MKLTSVVKDEIKKGLWDDRFIDIYGDPSLVPYHTNRFIEALTKFEELYGEQEISIFSAPGRSEVGGNHTDHQHCQVLAAGLNIDVIAIVAPTDDSIIKIVSDHRDIDPIDVSDTEKKAEEEGSSKSLIRGVVAKLKSDGYKAGGFRSYMTSDVLPGSGMSSSAAFEVTVGTILSGLYNNMEISPVYIAQASQYAENVYFGKPCGLMDQMASSVGSLVNIDFEDPSDPK